MTAVATPEGVVDAIAARRRADLASELQQPVDPASGPAPRPIAERLAAPGLHLIAELKRSSPSAGRIAGHDEDLVARARAYEAGGAAAISVLCEPHWFGGSVDDLRRVREAVSIPVLAKEFVVDERQLPMLRAAGADMVLLLAVLQPADVLAGLVRRAFELGLHVTPTSRLGGGTPDENARTIETVFRGESGSKRDVVLLNAGAAFLVAGEVEQLEGGIEKAALTIDAGLATELLERLRAERAAHVPATATT